MWHKIIKHVNTKIVVINAVTALCLTLYLELMERKSMASVSAFMSERTFMFFYNALLLFVILSPVFIAKKKIFTYGFLTGICILVGTVNGVILTSRSTPFTAVDITIAKSILPILRNYLETWQIVLGVIGVIVLVMALVCLYLYTPTYKKESGRGGGILFLLVILFFLAATVVGKKADILHRKFDNLIIGYQDYGVAYSFVVTMVDTGIDRPIEYSRDTTENIVKKTQKAFQKLQADKSTDATEEPNVIFIQLESFFDITQVKDLSFSEDPLPVLHQMQEQYISGNLSVPVYGAGTINTEFEVMSGMNTDYFGTGEYPYRSILHKTQCDNMAYWMKDAGYTSTVIHNNNASFYDRDYVFSNMGYDYFITSENMNIKSTNEVGWAKDSILTSEIMNTLEKTDTKDYIYTISVQGHGDYPTTEQENPEITVTSSDEEETESHLNQVTYYTNQIHEMDAFIKELTEELVDYPEEVILVFYGDHLPSLEYETDDLKSGTKYQTPYVIWDNYGYSKEHKAELSENVQSWQLAAKTLSQTDIDNGILNQYHQAMQDDKNYKKNLRLLQYDLLYGGKFSLEDTGVREASTLSYSLNEIKIDRVKYHSKKYYLLGENFTSQSRVYVNGVAVSTKVLNSNVIVCPSSKIKNGDEVTIHQVSKTNEKITLNQSDVFVFDKDDVTYLYHSEER